MHKKKQSGFTPLERPGLIKQFIFGDLVTSKKDSLTGFTLIETIIALGIFAVVAVAIYFSYANVLSIVSGSSLNLTSLSIIENEIEAIRNMAYEDVGVVGGAPAGKLQALKTITRGDSPFSVRTTIRSIDDPFDGMIGGTPNDLAPADYKLVEIEVTCANCQQEIPATMTTTVAPQNLESATKNGALFINVFDASGNPVAGADVSIRNNLVTPNIAIDEVTNIRGELQLVDIATSSFGYSVSVSKSGYSSDRTYLPGDPANPNPVNPNATVAKQQVTTISFAIDDLSTLNLKTADAFCRPIGNIDFLLAGSKLIGTDPDIKKYSQPLSTDASGNYAISGLEWDSYDLQNFDSAYDIGGADAQSPFLIGPGSVNNFTWLMEPKKPFATLVTVKNQAGQLIDDAKVTLSKAGFSESRFSGQRPLFSTDWSGGRYFDKSILLDENSPAGSLVLGQIDGKYATSSIEWLVSQTTDFGVNDTVFFDLGWSPVIQPPLAGSDSLKIQIATNNDNTTWNFIGPDGTSGSYYTTGGTQIHSSHFGNRYLRYKVFLSSLDETVTPQLDDLTVNFRSSCTLNGQAYFDGLSSGTYTVTVEKAGYQTLTETGFSVTKSWQEYRATIIPL